MDSSVEDLDVCFLRIEKTLVEIVFLFGGPVGQRFDGCLRLKLEADLDEIGHSVLGGLTSTLAHLL